MKAGQSEEVARIEAARSGDPRALAELYDLHAAGLYRLAFRLTSSAIDAEDVLHDVFVGLPEALRTYAGTGSLAAWLRRVTTRVALMKFRRRKRRREVQIPVRLPVLRGRSRPPIVERVFVERLLERLPEEQRAVVVLKELEGFSHAEIAEILGITIGASRQRLHRARVQLRRLAGRERGE